MAVKNLYGIVDPQKILVVCFGNTDRSPFYAAALKTILARAGHIVTVESAGVDEKAAGSPGGAAPLALETAKWFGLDLSGHEKRWVGSPEVELKSYDLIICAGADIAGLLLEGRMELKPKVVTTTVTNEWPIVLQEQMDQVVEQVTAGALKVKRCFFTEK